MIMTKTSGSRPGPSYFAGSVPTDAASMNRQPSGSVQGTGAATVDHAGEPFLARNQVVAINLNGFIESQGFRGRGICGALHLLRLFRVGGAVT